MKVTISSVADKEDLEKERILLKVQADTDIGEYLLLQTGFKDEDVTIGVRHAFWFPYKPVAAGDLVVVYTKRGTQTESTLKSGKKAHFFYWDIGSPIWGTPDRAPVLLHAPDWDSKRPDEL
ncbi:hypothetical protein J2X06_003375 [Lysobacter niastensis]|uniref:Uncharacterized protein n=1 Tax=Lysobacter niastensis TaxID=380629 RepID=A0ABU1WFJ4_9GAMM|nr:hypothetical protein [Lysobacter niastensis]MDR7136157.1 hypothetical protein [Lysobacter niastensis]